MGPGRDRTRPVPITFVEIDHEIILLQQYGYFLMMWLILCKMIILCKKKGFA